MCRKGLCVPHPRRDSSKTHANHLIRPTLAPLIHSCQTSSFSWAGPLPLLGVSPQCALLFLLKIGDCTARKVDEPFLRNLAGSLIIKPDDILEFLSLVGRHTSSLPRCARDFLNIFIDANMHRVISALGVRDLQNPRSTIFASILQHLDTEVFLNLFRYSDRSSSLQPCVKHIFQAVVFYSFFKINEEIVMGHLSSIVYLFRNFFPHEIQSKQCSTCGIVFDLTPPRFIAVFISKFMINISSVRALFFNLSFAPRRESMQDLTWTSEFDWTLIAAMMRSLCVRSCINPHDVAALFVEYFGHFSGSQKFFFDFFQLSMTKAALSSDDALHVIFTYYISKSGQNIDPLLISYVLSYFIKISDIDPLKFPKFLLAQLIPPLSHRPKSPQLLRKIQFLVDAIVQNKDKLCKYQRSSLDDLLAAHTIASFVDPLEKQTLVLVDKLVFSKI